MAYTLNIKVIEAKDLMAADRNGLSDPFVDVEINTKTRSNVSPAMKFFAPTLAQRQVTKEKKKTTKTIKKTLNPMWNEEFSFKVDNIARLDFKVWDWDAIGSNTHIGTCFLDITDIPMGVYSDFWIPLPTKGSLHVAVNPVDFVPASNVTPGYYRVLFGPLVFPQQKTLAVTHTALGTIRIIDQQLEREAFKISEYRSGSGSGLKVADMSGTCLIFVFIPRPHAERSHFRLSVGGNGGLETHEVSWVSVRKALQLKVTPKSPAYPEVVVHGHLLKFAYTFEQNGIAIARVDHEGCPKGKYQITIMPNVDVGLILSCCAMIDRVVRLTKAAHEGVGDTVFEVLDALTEL